MRAKYGGDFDGDTISYGSNLFFSSGTFAQEQGLTAMSSGRPSDFGIEMYQGNLTTIDYKSLAFSYLINPYTNFKISIAMIFRKSHNSYNEVNTQFFNFGLKSDLFNYYYDM